MGGVKNAYRSSKSVSKTRTVRQKVGVEASKTCTVRQKVRQKHVPLGKKSAMAPSPLGQGQRGAKPLPVPASIL